MDEFARLPADDRRPFIEEAANRRDLTPIIIEKDFWACWTLRRLVETPGLREVTFKGGTSLSKAYGIIQRFSEDIDLTLRRSAPLIRETASPMDDGITGGERKRRTEKLREAAQAYVTDIAMAALSKAIEQALGHGEGWDVELDPDDKDRQTLLFHYPAAIGGKAPGYIQPRIKLEYGARGEPEPFEKKAITPYLAEEFPDELPGSPTMVPALSVERTYWEKVTLLHSLHHKGTLGANLSRHYYDLLMLDRAGVTEKALARLDLLEAVVRDKSLMFTQKSASYDTAVRGQLRLMPTDNMTTALAGDYAAMAEMFMVEPPTISELTVGLAELEAKLNDTGEAVAKR
jgi:predicted nucleotidyltransferase component of viral defense system